LGSLDLGRLRSAEFTQDEVDFLTQIASQVAIAVDNAIAYGQIADLKNELAQARVDEKKFRADLFYRLNVFPIFIPPLRWRF